MGNRWKSEVSRTILNIFRPYNGIGVPKLRFLEELFEKTFVMPYVEDESNEGIRTVSQEERMIEHVFECTFKNIP